MRFIDGLVELDSIENKEQSEAVIIFLEHEAERHRRDRDMSEGEALRWLTLAASGEYDAPDYAVARALMLASAVYRHSLDIEATKNKIANIRDKIDDWEQS